MLRLQTHITFLLHPDGLLLSFLSCTIPVLSHRASCAISAPIVSSSHFGLSCRKAFCSLSRTGPRVSILPHISSIMYISLSHWFCFSTPSSRLQEITTLLVICFVMFFCGSRAVCHGCKRALRKCVCRFAFKFAVGGFLGCTMQHVVYDAAILVRSIGVRLC